VVEVLPVDETVSRLIDSGQPPDMIAAAARKIGMHSLWESGLERAWQGLTTLDELVRVLGERVQEDGSTVPNRPSVVLVPGAVRAAVVAAAVPASAAPGPAPGAPKEGGSEGTVLVADDDPQMRRLVRSVLERDGFTVIEAEDGIDALDKLMQHSEASLLILDHDMPRLNGLGVLEELRANVTTASLPVVMLTARTDDTESQALDLGAQDYLTKPIRPSALSARVRAVLRRVKA
jgi:CheY-like chemotaxis protein